MPMCSLYKGDKTHVYEIDYGEFNSLHLVLEIGITHHQFELPEDMDREEAADFAKKLEKVINEYLQ